MTIDERIEALTQTVELLAGMHRETEELVKTSITQTHDEIKALTAEVRRFRFWAEAVILNHESRLRALAKEPPPEEPL